MTHRVFWTQVNRAVDLHGDPIPNAVVTVYRSGTTEVIDLFADAVLEQPRENPVRADGDGIFPPIFVDGGTELRVVMATQDGVTLPGYPIDPIVPLSSTDAGAQAVTFEPTEAVPYTNVQEAIVGLAGQVATAQATLNRSLIPFQTGGTGNAFTLTPTPAITGYAIGQAFLVRADRPNNGPATLNVNNLGARPWMVTRRVDLQPVERASGEIQPGAEELVTYDGVRFITILDRASGDRGFVENRGAYVKYPDGSMEARDRIYLGGRMVGGAGTYADPWMTGGNDWVFPIAFTTAPQVQITLEIDAATPVGARGMSTTFFERTTTRCNGIRAFCTSGISHSANVYAHVVATGRWF